MIDDILSLLGIPFVTLAVLVILARDLAMMKVLWPVGWAIMGLLLVGVWVDN